jgi:hypothetical protein
MIKRSYQFQAGYSISSGALGRQALPDQHSLIEEGLGCIQLVDTRVVITAQDYLIVVRETLIIGHELDLGAPLVKNPAEQPVVGTLEIGGVISELG